MKIINTVDGLLEVGEFISTLERRQGLKVASLEGIAYQLGWGSREQLARLALKLGERSCAVYLQSIAKVEP